MRGFSQWHWFLSVGTLLDNWRLLTASYLHMSTSLGNGCGYSFTADQSSGSIYSPNYPFDYRPGLSCDYEFYPIKLQSKIRVCFIFRRFDLHEADQSGSCKLDHVTFPGGIPYCGSGIKDSGYITSNASAHSMDSNLDTVWSNSFCWSVYNTSLAIKFVSNSSQRHRGFYAQYQIWHDEWQADDVEECGLGHVTATQPIREEHQYVPGCLVTCPDGSKCDTWTNPNCACPQNTAPCSRDEFTCFNRKCIPASATCNHADRCGDDSDESYDHARCPGGDLLKNIVQVCDFEFDHCGLLGAYSWQIDSPVNFTHGPDSDHTVGPEGHYLRTNFVQKPDADSVDFFTQAIRHSPDGVCVSFWYWMASDNSGFLKVLSGGKSVWLSGRGSGRWHSCKMSLSSTSLTHLTFEAVKGLTAEGEIALDDLYVQSGPCQQVLEPMCTFEHDACGWTQSKQPITSSTSGGVGWQLLDNNTIGQGQFLYIKSAGAVHQNDVVSLESPYVSPNLANYYCLRFLLYVNNPASQLQVEIDYPTLDKTIFVRSITNITNLDEWHPVELTLEVEALFKLLIGIEYLEDNHVIAIDDISIMAGKCVEETEEMTTMPIVQSPPPPQTSTVSTCPNPEEGPCTNDKNDNAPTAQTLSTLAILVVVAVAVILVLGVVTLTTVYMCSKRRARPNGSSNAPTLGQTTPQEPSNTCDNAIGSSRGHVMPQTITSLHNDDAFPRPGIYVPVCVPDPKYVQRTPYSDVRPSSDGDVLVFERAHTNQAGSIDRFAHYQVRLIPAGGSPPPPYCSGNHGNSQVSRVSLDLDVDRPRDASTGATNDVDTTARRIHVGDDPPAYEEVIETSIYDQSTGHRFPESSV